jgi:hypothetical protein
MISYMLHFLRRLLALGVSLHSLYCGVSQAPCDWAYPLICVSIRLLVYIYSAKYCSWPKYNALKISVSILVVNKLYNALRSEKV